MFRYSINSKTFYIHNGDGSLLFFEDFLDYWVKYEYDQNGKEIFLIDKTGYWVESSYTNSGASKINSFGQI